VTFDDLPLVADEDDARRIHQTAGLFLLNRTLVAHEGLSCQFIDSAKQVVGSNRWRVATDAQVRALGGSWCVDCCGI
jgi:hypothetical protein